MIATELCGLRRAVQHQGLWIIATLASSWLTASLSNPDPHPSTSSATVWAVKRFRQQEPGSRGLVFDHGAADDEPHAYPLSLKLSLRVRLRRTRQSRNRKNLRQPTRLPRFARNDKLGTREDDEQFAMRDLSPHNCSGWPGAPDAATTLSYGIKCLRMKRSAASTFSKIRG